MPNWGQVLDEFNTSTSKTALDDIRHRYLDVMHQYTGRNVIAYYSAFLQKNGSTEIDDNDTNAFMQAISGLDRSKGLDLILHTPGGGIAAAESLVSYLRATFGNDIRAFIPQIAMSAGRMTQNDIYEGLRKLEISVEPAPEHYSPEEYGKWLMRGVRNIQEIRYSNKVTVDVNNQPMKVVYG